MARRLITIIVLVTILSLTSLGVTAIAEESTSSKIVFETQNVMDDLKGATIGGREFDISDYPHKSDSDVAPQILSFVEFGYSYDSSKQDDFDLYLLLYNPSEQVIDDNGLCKIQLSCSDGNQSKYPLEILNYSRQVGSEGRFYKFKVVLAPNQRLDFLRRLNSSERIYKVTGIELSYGGVVRDYTVAQTYTYTGFSLGYGSEHMSQSTLLCRVDGLERYVQLDVTHTVYRPQGDFYEGEQSQLNSCYFAVPKSFWVYGDLTKILCEWVECVTNPILVTESTSAYNLLYNLHGANISNLADYYYFLLTIGNFDDPILWTKSFSYTGGITNWSKFNDRYLLWKEFDKMNYADLSHFEDLRFNNFAAVFSANGSFRDRYITSEEIEEQLLLNSAFLGDTSVCGRFAKSMFSSIAADGIPQKFFVSRDDQKTLFSNVTTKDFWQTAFGGYDVVSQEWATVKSIVTVTSEDLQGADVDVANRLLIYEADVPALRTAFSKAHSDIDEKEIVLLRYGQSTYYCNPVADALCGKSTENADDYLVNSVINVVRDGYNGYAARETVYLNFDIISLFFTLDDVETEIPVVSSPSNAIGGTTPPLEENYHNEQYVSQWKTIIAILGIVAAVIVVVLLLVAISLLRSYLAPYLAPIKQSLSAARSRRQKQSKRRQATKQNKKKR